MEQLLVLNTYERLRCLLDILNAIAHSKEKRPLASLAFRNTFHKDDAERIDIVYNYLFRHFSEDITLLEIAHLINMNPSAFCKFFKKRSGKTFSQVLKEIRVGHACKLLLEDKHSISEVAYPCGYHSLSYFNRRFKVIDFRRYAIWIAATNYESTYQAMDQKIRLT